MEFLQCIAINFLPRHGNYYYLLQLYTLLIETFSMLHPENRGKLYGAIGFIQCVAINILLHCGNYSY